MNENLRQYTDVSVVVDTIEGLDSGLSMLKINGEHILIEEIKSHNFIEFGENAGKYELVFDGTIVFERNTVRLPKHMLEAFRRVSGFSDDEINEASNVALLEMLIADSNCKDCLNGIAIKNWVTALWEVQINW